MKKTYLNPELLVLELAEADIVTMSSSEMPEISGPSGEDQDWGDL